MDIPQRRTNESGLGVGRVLLASYWPLNRRAARAQVVQVYASMLYAVCVSAFSYHHRTRRKVTGVTTDVLASFEQRAWQRAAGPGVELDFKVQAYKDRAWDQALTEHAWAAKRAFIISFSRDV